MRVLVMSDVHANYTALQAVLQDAGEVDETWCLGDLVGYGPDPNAVVEEISEIPNLTCMMGNHDIAVTGKMPFDTFNNDARAALMHHEKVLTATNMDFLRGLHMATFVHEGVTLAHGSPRDPLWEYVISAMVARVNFSYFETQVCFVGHSHVQGLFEYNAQNDRIVHRQPTLDKKIKLNSKMILNPGSVGQPRDRDPRAAYAIYDALDNSWTPRRVEYNIAAVQQRIREAKLPEKHALRLAEGW